VLESQTSQSVADALGAIEQDAYVMDYKLPDGTGLDIAERIRSKWGATPIILMSGYDTSTVASRAEKFHAFFLQKPFSREMICNAVMKAIGLPKVALARSEPGNRHLIRSVTGRNRRGELRDQIPFASVFALAPEGDIESSGIEENRPIDHR
jgi:DNA-binding NtrC family response regulator